MSRGSGGRPVVTGLGTVHAFGFGSEALAEALALGAARRVPIAPAAGVPRRHGRSTEAALAVEAPIGRWLAPLAARRLSPPSRMAVATARAALEQAGLELPAEVDPMTAVVTSTAYGPASFTERLLEQLFREGPEAVSPALFTECVANAAAAQVALDTRAGGPNLTVCQREAGDLAALARAGLEVARGRARRALAGCTEEVSPLLHSILDAFGALAAGPARPFDRNRDGFVAASGATIAVVEREDDAQARGVRPLARLRAWGAGFDPTASRSGWGTGAAGLGRGLAALLARAEVSPGDVDLIVSGASGAVAGDRLEAATLRAAWNGRPLPPVVAPKATTGEYGGGHLAAAILAAAGRPFGPTAGFAEADPELGLVPHDGRPLPPPRIVLATALAAGGAAAWVILECP